MKYAWLLVLAVAMGGCSEVGDAIKGMDLSVAAKADQPVVTTVAKEDPKPTPVISQRKIPKVCTPLVIQAAAKVSKVEGGKTPQEAVDAAHLETGDRLVKLGGAHRQCYCWMISEGLVNVPKDDAERACKGVTIPKAL